MAENAPAFFAFVLLLTVPPIAIGAELWKAARNRGYRRLWCAGALLYVLVVTLACQYYKVRWQIYEAVGRWTSHGWRRYLLWLLVIEAASFAGIGLILAWDWLVYRRIPWGRWKSRMRRMGGRDGRGD